MKFLALLCILLSLSACTHTTRHLPSKPRPHPVVAAPVVVQPETLQSPEYYLKQAAAQTTDLSLRNHFILYAAKSFLRAGEPDKASQLMSTLEFETLESDNQIQYQFVTAELALINNRPVDALQALQAIPNPDTQAIATQITYKKLLAHSYEAFGQALESIKVRLDLSLLLNNPKEEKKNKQAIWLLSQQLSEASLTQLSQDSTQATLSGWAALTLIARHSQSDPAQLMQAVQAWKATYPNHPANTLLSDLLPATHSFAQLQQPRHIAVILPMQGPLSAQATAVWEGILYSYYQTPAENRPELLLYDSSQTKIGALYEQAVKAGADFVLGPLTKDNVNSAKKNATLITLSLNYSDRSPSKNVYEFGLTLNQDAEQIAEHLAGDHLSRVLTITMDDPNSQTALQSFKQKFEALGGKTVGELTLTSRTDLNTAIVSLLQFQATSKTRRQDVDAIFINLAPSQARAIMPLLQADAAGDLPLYATSLIDSGKLSSSQNSDLSPIIFVDIPFLINPNDEMLKAGQALNDLFGDQYKNYVKLYAVGMDAYRLVFELARLKIFPESSYAGSTGVLSLDKHQQIYHELSWGQFTKTGMTPLIAKTQSVLRDV